MRSNGNCVIFTSQTGVGVNGALEKLASLCRERGRKVELHKVETLMQQKFAVAFPKDRMSPRITSEVGMQYLLFKPKQKLTDLWKKAIDDVARPSQDNATKFISLHTVFYHSQTREFFSPVDSDYLRTKLSQANLSVKLVVSLVDDIYDVYRRLRRPGHLLSPTEAKPAFQAVVEAIYDLIILLDWRSREIMTAEQMARSVGAKHFVVATKHPITVAYDLLFTEKHPVYVSHPITQVRVLERNGKRGEANNIKAEIGRLVRLLGESKNLLPFYPTTIDEFIIERIGNVLVPRLTDRWPIGRERDLLFCSPTLRNINPLDPSGWYRGGRQRKSGDLKAIDLLLSLLSHLIQMQIGSRDRKLVEQSEALVVFRPFFNGRLSQGVLQEVLHRNALVQYEVAKPGERECIVATPSKDLTDWRIRSLIQNLSETAKVGRARPKRASLTQIESRMRKKVLSLQKLRQGSVTGRDLRDSIGPAAQKFVFDNMPRPTGPLGGDVRTVQRVWLDGQWDERANKLNADPLRRELTDGTDLVLDSASPDELAKKAEKALSS